ncbi:patatin [Echinicola sp. CAU 1574]|uniref:Patatin n=1 Tax=Echinicola arenosa TaxID=2774144 RepID=A0ABR9AJP0_9BACT|nr:patatin [Echinicola arenosa]MBD8489042.1 patatin [Echinicola arenosa]
MKKNLTFIVIGISIITIISGVTQMIMPEMVLKIIGAEISDSTKHLFGIIGMFMALFGSLMVHTVYQTHTSKTAVFWCAMQKLGAFIAVTLGVFNGLFSWMAMGVAVFDLFSAGLFLYYLTTLQKP